MNLFNNLNLSNKISFFQIKQNNINSIFLQIEKIQIQIDNIIYFNELIQNFINMINNIKTIQNQRRLISTICLEKEIKDQINNILKKQNQMLEMKINNIILLQIENTIIQIIMNEKTLNDIILNFDNFIIPEVNKITHEMYEKILNDNYLEMKFYKNNGVLAGIVIYNNELLIQKTNLILLEITKMDINLTNKSLEDLANKNNYIYIIKKMIIETVQDLIFKTDETSVLSNNMVVAINNIRSKIENIIMVKNNIISQINNLNNNNLISYENSSIEIENTNIPTNQINRGSK